MFRRILPAALVLAFYLLSPGSAQAQYGYEYGFGPWGAFGLWNAQMALRSVNTPTPPYFSVYPPVYYDGLIRRPYGDSPFAYWPRRPQTRTILTAPRSAPAPQIVENPFYRAAPTSPSDEAPAASSNSTSQLIRNPFYTPGGLARAD